MLAQHCYGEVTERPIVLVSKTSVPVRVPRVRIPPSPLLMKPRIRGFPAEFGAFPLVVGVFREPLGELRPKRLVGLKAGFGEPLAKFLDQFAVDRLDDFAAILAVAGRDQSSRFRQIKIEGGRSQ